MNEADSLLNETLLEDLRRTYDELLSIDSAIPLFHARNCALSLSLSRNLPILDATVDGVSEHCEDGSDSNQG